MSRWRLAYWLVVAVTLGVYAAMLIWTLPGISAGAGGLAPFDMRPTGYSADDARAFLAVLSDDARQLYLGPQAMLDRAYPILLAVVLGGAIWMLFSASWLRWGLLGAVGIGMIADFVENARVAAMLAQVAPVSDAMAQGACRATVVKSAASGIAIVAVLAGAARAMWRRRARR